ncbi:hypothetical protein AVW11_30650 [Streptomyces amritsarensis]|uniref:Uncharacterized protein n=1 Tax=Streptomyces amritsarensis TaxID=681158 RepID=A0ABX3FXU1_9ACTN|nr:hypothetical protein AVW11_30650 [Streptomyces amritsarensis]
MAVAVAVPVARTGAVRETALAVEEVVAVAGTGPAAACRTSAVSRGGASPVPGSVPVGATPAAPAAP